MSFPTPMPFEPVDRDPRSRLCSMSIPVPIPASNVPRQYPSDYYNSSSNAYSAPSVTSMPNEYSSGSWSTHPSSGYYPTSGYTAPSTCPTSSNYPPSLGSTATCSYMSSGYTLPATTPNYSSYTPQPYPSAYTPSPYTGTQWSEYKEPPAIYEHCPTASTYITGGSYQQDRAPQDSPSYNRKSGSKNSGTSHYAHPTLPPLHQASQPQTQAPPSHGHDGRSKLASILHPKRK